MIIHGLLAIRMTAVVAACLSFACHGRRTRATAERWMQRHLHETHRRVQRAGHAVSNGGRRASVSSLAQTDVLAGLLLSINPGVGWQVAGVGHGRSFSVIREKRSPWSLKARSNPSRKGLPRPETRLRSRHAHATAISMQLKPSKMITKEAFDDAKKAAVEEKWAQKLPIEEFLQRGGLLGGVSRSASPHILDVRAPCEYAQGHIPGAISVPLFDDDERAKVGKLYKHQGHDQAVNSGLKIVEQKGWEQLLSSVPEVSEGDEVLVYCFRGGMRSGGMAHLLSRAPLNVSTLDGGYKRFRNWALSQWEQKQKLVIVGGPTGSGKTEVLQTLRDELQQQVIDLEGDANHRGSAFGALGRPMQPSNEHYENILAVQWANFHSSAPIFIEDESHNVGKVGVPQGLYARMRAENTPVLRLNVPREARVSKLVSEYGQYPPEDLSSCCKGLVQRLGHARVNETVDLLAETPPRLAEVADLLLEHYYDPMYSYQDKKKKHMDVTEIACESGDALENAQRLLDALSQHGLSTK